MRKQTVYKRFMYMLALIICLVFSWEADGNTFVNRASGNGKAMAMGESSFDTIPQQSIRLRILANSDAPADQWIKREVRDAIVEQMKQWVSEPQGIESARAAVRGHLPELDKLVGATLHQYGFTYSYKVELGMVPFPAKMYGSQIYPAGDYEALRVSIGSAEGQNWWCVLFPPLCFIDSEVIAKKPEVIEKEANPYSGKDGAKPTANKQQTSEKSGVSGNSAKAAATAGAAAAGDVNQEAGKSGISGNVGTPNTVGTVQPEMHFYLWDLFNKWFS